MIHSSYSDDSIELESLLCRSPICQRRYLVDAVTTAPAGVTDVPRDPFLDIHLELVPAWKINIYAVGNGAFDGDIMAVRNSNGLQRPWRTDSHSSCRWSSGSASSVASAFNHLLFTFSVYDMTRTAVHRACCCDA